MMVAIEMPEVNIETPVYPPAPWVMSGQCWFGFFKADVPIEPPVGLKPFLDPRLVAIILVRYLDGTLRYDELGVGGLARRGSKIGLYVNHLWVDNEQSMWGGRRIWGLPKNLARFEWLDDAVQVSDDNRVIAVIEVDRSDAHSPKMTIPAPGFGVLDGQLVYSSTGFSMRPASAQMRVLEWSSRFPYRIGERPQFGMAGKPFSASIGAPNPIK